MYRSAALTIYNTLLAKGTKTPPEKIQIMSVLNVMAFIPTLEQNSRLVGKSRSNEEERFREILAKLLSSQGVEAVKVYEDVSNACVLLGRLISCLCVVTNRRRNPSRGGEIVVPNITPLDQIFRGSQ